ASGARPRYGGAAGGPPVASRPPRLPAEGEIGLRGKRSDANPRQIETRLVHDEAALPPRKELAIEQQQVVELEMSLEPKERPALEPLQLRQLGFRREQRCKRCEIQRHTLDAFVACPIDRDAHEPLI